MKKLLLLTIVALLSSCVPTVTPNEFVVVTADCWNHFSVLKAGQVAPRLMTTCDRKIVLPAGNLDFSFQASVRFKGGDSGVKADLKIDGQYRIIDPTTFITVNKGVTSSPTDDHNFIKSEAFEKIENSAIDKIIKDVVRDFSNSVIPTEADENKLENDLVPLINKALQQRGVEVFNVSIDIDFSPQTESALDVISAYNLYKEAGLENVGSKVIQNQAGKASIIIQTKKDSL